MCVWSISIIDIQLVTARSSPAHCKVCVGGAEELGRAVGGTRHEVRPRIIFDSRTINLAWRMKSVLYCLLVVIFPKKGELRAILSKTYQ